MNKSRFTSILLFIASLTALSAEITEKENPTPQKQQSGPSYPPMKAMVDLRFSPYMGAEDLITAQRLLQKVEERWLPVDPSRKRWYDCMGRFSELTFLWMPLNYTEMVIQHEVFGHGYRARSLGPSTAQVKKYIIGTPPPYGAGGGATGIQLNPDKTTAFSMAAIYSAGVESTALLAGRLKMHWMAEGKLPAKESGLYTWSLLDLPFYAAASLDDLSSGDINAYVSTLNRTYPKGKLSTAQLQRQSLVTLLDPMLYYAMYSWWLYVLTGKPGPIPMIHIGDVGYLPNARYGLTPFGPEYYLENFFVKNNIPTYFYLRYGKHAGNTYWGTGVENSALFTHGAWTAGLRFDLWYQPHHAYRDKSYSLDRLLLNELPPPPKEPFVGMAASLLTSYKIHAKASLFAELGAKTSGFLPGEPLESSAIIRLGVAF
jgi:hypothetical protein